MYPKEKKLLKLSANIVDLSFNAKYDLAVIHVFQPTRDDEPKMANSTTLKNDLSLKLGLDSDWKFSLAVTYEDNDSLLDISDFRHVKSNLKTYNSNLIKLVSWKRMVDLERVFL